MQKATLKAYSYYNTALDQITSDQVSDAILSLEQAIRYEVMDKDILSLMGICQYLDSNFDKAKFYLEKSLYLGEKQPDIQQLYMNIISESFYKFLDEYNQAIDLMQTNQYSKATRILMNIRKACTDWHEIDALISFAYGLQKKWKSAIKYMREAYKKDSTNKYYVQYLAIYNQENGNKHNKINKMLEIALVLLIIGIGTSGSRVVKQIKEKEGILIQLKQKENILIQQENRYKEQTKNYKELEDEFIRREEEWLNNQMQQTASIVEDEEDTTKITSDNEYEVFREGVKYYRKQEYEEAVVCLQPVVEQCTNEELVKEAIFFLAKAYQQNGAYEEAKENYEHYINMGEYCNYYDDVLYEYGMMLYHIGKVEESKNILKQIIDCVPNSIFNNSRVQYVINQ